jgi:hypothetical protein
MVKDMVNFTNRFKFFLVFFGLVFMVNFNNL